MRTLRDLHQIQASTRSFSTTARRSDSQVLQSCPSLRADWFDLCRLPIAACDLHRPGFLPVGVSFLQMVLAAIVLLPVVSYCPVAFAAGYILTEYSVRGVMQSHPENFSQTYYKALPGW